MRYYQNLCVDPSRFVLESGVNREIPDRERAGGSDKYPNTGGDTMGHESSTKLFEERFVDAGREAAVVPTPVLSALRAQISASIDDFVLAEVKQRLAECLGRMSPENGTAVVRHSYQEGQTVLTDLVGSVAVRILRIRSHDGKRENFVSALIKPFQRLTPHTEDALAYKHLMGRALGRMADMMSLMFGTERLESQSVPMPSRLKRK